MDLYTWGLPAGEDYKEYSFKRVFDIILSAIGFILWFPLGIIISAFIYLETGRPIFFVQERIGKSNRVFKMIKFRSMTKDAESKTLGLHDKEVPKEMVTKVGRILRDTAFDELPQLIHILKGDMSFVGPRPLLETEAGLLNLNKLGLRLSIRPGLTGLAQVYGRDDISEEQKLRFDLLYIKRMNFILDLKLIFLSFWITFKGKWKKNRSKSH
jgi:lipopolysaccharide/colanic/teichoic acid biosynthesis glycosyltransferase